jgi:hypothetical protein
MKRWLLGIVIAMMLTGCDSGTKQPAQNVTRPVTSTDLRVVQGQTVYVPAYAAVFTETDKTLQLTVTLAIHNTDPEHAIVIRSVRYYGTDGKLVKDYLSAPVEIGSYATAGYVVEKDSQAGWGANFVVEWGAAQDVYEPVIEAVMVGTSFGHSISLISPGRVVSEISEAE